MEIKTSAEFKNISVGELKGWDKNPRDINDENLARLEEQILKLGIYKPLLVNKDNVVLGGNMRLKVYQKHGIESVPCCVVDAQDEEKMIEYALSDNDRAGEYKIELLNELVKNTNIDLNLYKVDIAKAVTINNIVSQFTRNTADEAPEPDPENVDSKYGEVYTLGEHRLMCGDSTRIEDVEKLMGGGKARLIFTDPPYMVDYKSANGNSYNTGKYKHDGIFNDNLSDSDALEFYKKVGANLYAVSDENVSLYWWYASMKQHINREALIQSGWNVNQIVIWVKDRMVMAKGQMYHRVYEPCIVGWKKGNKNFKNKFVANLKDVWSLNVSDFAELADIWYAKKDNQNSYVHPTQKPTALVEKALKRSSHIGDIVLDLFGGSGSTMAGCFINNRISYTMELDPVYCDVIRKRYAKLLNKENEWKEITSR